MEKVLLVSLLVFMFLVVTSVFISQLMNIRKRGETAGTVINMDKRRGDPYPTLNFTTDCSRLDNESQDDCQTFFYNQEHVLYPEMKKMIGIDLRWCFHTINITMYSTREEYIEVCGGGGACAGVDPNSLYRDIAYIAYGPKFLPSFASIENDTCIMDSHELHHVFDSCITFFGSYEVSTVASGRIQKRLCPNYEYPYNLHSLYYLQIMNKSDDDFEVKDCSTARAYVIYKADEEFFHKYYEWLLKKDLGIPKRDDDITEAIIYASDHEGDYYVKKYCLGWSDKQGTFSIISAHCQNNHIKVTIINGGFEAMHNLLWYVDGAFTMPIDPMCDDVIYPFIPVTCELEGQIGEHNITIRGPKNEIVEHITC